jgi:diacylglycerol kinase (ATP)
LGNGNNKGIRRLKNAFRYSVAGFKAAWINEEAFRQEILLAILIVPVGMWIYFIIPLTELLNTAIEATVDRVGQEHHELSGRAKDLGSAAVFLSICITLIVWIIISYGRFFG